MPNSGAPARDIPGVIDVDGEPESSGVGDRSRAPAQPRCEPPPRSRHGRSSQDEGPEVESHAPEDDDCEPVLARGQPRLVERVRDASAE
eukprot:5197886-Alexandrium_andersonii.AAC.1